jgi:hypothetical protein
MFRPYNAAIQCARMIELIAPTEPFNHLKERCAARKEERAASQITPGLTEADGAESHPEA